MKLPNNQGVKTSAKDFRVPKISDFRISVKIQLVFCTRILANLNLNQNLDFDLKACST